MANTKDIKGGFAATERLSLRNRVALVVLVPLFGKSAQSFRCITSPESSQIGAHISRSVVSHFHPP